MRFNLFDVLILNGNLIDGTGSKSVKKDVGIIKDKIEAIGNLKQSSSKVIIDATGKTISQDLLIRMLIQMLLY